MPVLVIIPAAGSGTRFGGEIPKQFQPLAGKPIVQYIVERFLLSGFVEKVVREAMSRRKKKSARR